MSRIFDALRLARGRSQPSVDGRAPHADAVLAALGYKSAGPRRPNGAFVALVVFGFAIAAAVWWSLPPTVTPNLAVRGAPPKQVATPPAAPPHVLPATGPVAKPGEPKPVETRPEPAPPVAAQDPVVRTPAVARPPNVTRTITPQTAASAPESPARAQPDEFKLALYYQRIGDFEQALVHYKTVLQRDEMNADAHNNLGNLYMSKALYDDASREFRRVVAVEPKYVTAHVNLSAALYQLKRYDESAAEARAAIRLEPRNSDAYVNLALAQAAAGQHLDARASLGRALEIDTHNAAAHYNLALQYEQAGEFALALDHYRAFLQYAGPEQAGYAADVRSRVQALERR